MPQPFFSELVSLVNELVTVLDVTSISLTLGKKLMVASCRTDCITTLVLSFSAQTHTKCSKQLSLLNRSKTVQPTHIPHTSLLSYLPTCLSPIFSMCNTLLLTMIRRRPRGQVLSKKGSLMQEHLLSCFKMF